MDICFALDSSGSIGESYFQIELDWFSDFVQSGLSQNARVGIINFSTDVDVELNFVQSESYSSSELADFILTNIPYLDSFTNTVDAIEEAIDMFDSYSTDETTKVFVIMTDGNPKMPGNGDENVCQWANDLKSKEINTYILGVGDNWDEEKVDCLVNDVTTDIVYVTSFNYSAFDNILPDLTDITCPGKLSLLSCFCFFVLFLEWYEVVCKTTAKRKKNAQNRNIFHADHSPGLCDFFLFFFCAWYFNF